MVQAQEQCTRQFLSIVAAKENVEVGSEGE